jgi:hypothetical protein
LRNEGKCGRWEKEHNSQKSALLLLLLLYKYDHRTIATPQIFII